VQIRERAAEGVMVRKDSQVDARVADVGSARQTVSEVTDRKEYRTRILTTAEGVNFELAEVQGEMFQKTAAAMSGFF
jgi:Enterobacterial TraT complement resistance protein